MLSQEYFTHYPSRVFWAGGGVLATYIIASGSPLLSLADQPAFPLPPRPTARSEDRPLPPQTLFEDRDGVVFWELPMIENDLLISLSPVRPGQERGQIVAHVRLKSAQQSRCVSLPNRVFLQFNDHGNLGFQDVPGSFWMDLSLDGNETVSVKLSVAKEKGEIQQATFSRAADAPPKQKGEEFPLGSPLRVLGDCRWWGADLVAQFGSTDIKQRIEMGSIALDVGENDWIGWKGGRWIKMTNPIAEPDLPIARIHSVSGPTLEWDVWDATHTRLVIAQQPSQAARLKPDEWVSSLRIRSDRQISCTLEKQSVILRVGDWAIKENARWKVLRTPGEKQALVEGAKIVELFVLEKIDSKQKCIKGKLFCANRAQIIPIEATAANAKLNKRHLPSHAKGKAP